MKGHVPTPQKLADYMVEKLFDGKTLKQEDRVLFPGLGTGPFAEAVYRYCKSNGFAQPKGIGIESNPELVEEARARLKGLPIKVLLQDFLGEEIDLGNFDYVIGNPPYVSINQLSEDEKTDYRRRFYTASGRFDLYILFYEQALKCLNDDGRLVFVTPEKFEYVKTASPLRRLLSEFHVREIDHIDEDTFEGFVTYPTVTVVEKKTKGRTRVRNRKGITHEVDLPRTGESWASLIRNHGGVSFTSEYTLDDVTERVSCGVATGADKVFVAKEQEVDSNLRQWTYPTISGRQLTSQDSSMERGVQTEDVFLSPYRKDGSLIEEGRLGSFGEWLGRHRSRLEKRSCVKKNKRPWYGWHENPPMADLLQPKLLCKDVAAIPEFWLDPKGEIVPRHSVYYIVPAEGVDIQALQEYLNGREAAAWLKANCQRAANGHYRLQSKVLKKLPIPEAVISNTLPLLESTSK